MPYEYVNSFSENVVKKSLNFASIKMTFLFEKQCWKKWVRPLMNIKKCFNLFNHYTDVGIIFRNNRYNGSYTIVGFFIMDP